MARKPSKIFISYRRSDAPHATRAIAITLRQAFGDGEVFVDTDSVQLGEWPQQIRRALNAAEVVLVVIGPQWLDSVDERQRRRLNIKRDWVRNEIAESIKRRITIVPILLDGTVLPRAAALPRELSKLPNNQAEELRDSSWQAGIKRLIERLEEYGIKHASAKQLRAPKRRHPSMLLMDSHKKIYDRKLGAMNSYVIREILEATHAGLIAVEPVHPGWEGSDAIGRKQPDLIIVHYSCMDAGRPKNLQRFLRYMLLASARTRVIVYSRTNSSPNDKLAAARFTRTIENLVKDHKDRVFGLPIYRYRNRAQKFSDPETKLALQALVREVLAREG